MRRGHAVVRFLIRSIRGKNSCRKWFSLVNGVKEVSIWTYATRFIPSADIYVATDATTSPFLLKYPVDENKKYYFIQGYENWRMNDDQLIKTYHFPLKKIVISHWLCELLAKVGESCSIVPNGFDPNEFRLTIPIEKKEHAHVSMLYHEDPLKNSKMGFKALSLVKAVVPELKVSIFGVYPKPHDLPEYCIYYQSPSLNVHQRINNIASIYIGTSDNEGWGLTVMEAMACGQAIACTDNKGYREIATHEHNALISPVGCERLLADNIIRLINDDILRQHLARTGYQDVQKYTIHECAAEFEKCITSLL